MGGVGHEVATQSFELSLLRHVMNDEEGPLRFAVGRKDGGTGNLDAQSALPFGDFKFFAWQHLALARVLHVLKERCVADDQFKTEVHQVARSGENIAEGTIREMDVVGTVDDQYGFPQVAEGGFELGELVRALLGELIFFGNENVNRLEQWAPCRQQIGFTFTAQMRLPRLDRLIQGGQPLVLFPENAERDQQRGRH